MPLAHNVTTHVLLRNYHLLLKPVKREDVQPLWNISTSFIQIRSVLLCPKWRYTMAELTDGQKGNKTHNFIMVLVTQEPSQKPKAIPVLT